MSKRGFFAVDRGVFDDPRFAREPFTEVQAWLWLISEAAWKPRRVRIGNEVIELARGQLAHSQRFMAARWRWSRSRVRRFFKTLVLVKNGPLIAMNSDHETAHITICNYEQYAFGRPSKRPTIEPQSGPASAQHRPKAKKDETKKRKKKLHAPQAAQEATEKEKPEEAEPVNEPPKARLFRKGKTLLVSLGVREKRSGSLLGLWLKQKHDPDGILAALQYAVDHGVMEPIAWMTKLLAKDASHGKTKSASDRAFELADKWEQAELERAAGNGRAPDDA